MTLSHEQFAEFYGAVWGDDPFPWQHMLARRVLEEGWPECLDLPTASGKTACIDIAVFALACQADRPIAERTASRRIFFVVDRRIVVDAAYERAKELKQRLRRAKDGVLQKVAERLRKLHDGEWPLDVARIRGGAARDDGWVRSPAQPTIITGTVDQAGSRLLFRAYGPKQLSAPIHAALVANDSLIILDEAHCAVPFFQTAKAVERYRGAEWAQQPISNPFRVVVMSATPPAEASGVFPRTAEREAALDHPRLSRRFRAAKLAELAVARLPGNREKRGARLRGGSLDDDELVFDAADRASRLAAQGSCRIAVMVNRVAKARAIYAQLQAQTRLEDNQLNADLVLLTGRMRPLDRDDLVNRWTSQLKAAEQQPTLERPVIVVTTQCLEVGADFSFDALITECASLDALRQRFGRLDRLGMVENSKACVLIRASQVKTEEQIEKLEQDGKTDDPIYGNALARTWHWLNLNGEDPGERTGSLWIDFGVNAMDTLLPVDAVERRELLEPLVAPAPDAPVMLPAHVDCWVQTAPRPRPDPDVAVFLHGPARSEPDVSVVLRADLDPEHRDRWLEIVSLCSPTSLEAFSVPLGVVRAWLAGRKQEDAGGDVEGAVIEDSELPGPGKRAVVLWRGRRRGHDRSIVTQDPKEVRPHEVVLVPANDADVDWPGDIPPGPGHLRPLDVGDRAFLKARDRPLLRIHKALLEPWACQPAVSDLLNWAAGEGREDDAGDLATLLAALGNGAIATLDNGTMVQPPPDWMRAAAAALTKRKRKIEIIVHPAGGYVLTSRARVGNVERPEEDASAEEDDLTSESAVAVPLREHLDAVAAVARRFARRCLSEDVVGVVVQAARLHDWGKADWRFQVMLHQGNEMAAFRYSELLAKSDRIPYTLNARQRACTLARLPEGFRHEMISVQLVERSSELSEGTDRDLLLHLIASHHGHSRPFAPVVADVDPGDVDLTALGAPGVVSAEQRRSLVSPHSMDSGIPGRFWALTRRYGWWGLAYIEAILRLADWESSQHHEASLATAVKVDAEDAA
jgi:CRISPR-associated endonuclease/helicase Cas3